MNVLIFILAFVLIYRYILPRLEGFDGNCFKKQIPFRDSSLNMDNLVQWYNESKTFDSITGHYYSSGDYLDIEIQKAKNEDFSGLYQEEIDKYFKPIAEINDKNKVVYNDFFDQNRCTLDYIF